jgi:hypothetical protein
MGGVTTRWTACPSGGALPLRGIYRLSENWPYPGIGRPLYPKFTPCMQRVEIKFFVNSLIF